MFRFPNRTPDSYFANGDIVDDLFLVDSCQIGSSMFVGAFQQLQQSTTAYCRVKINLSKEKDLMCVKAHILVPFILTTVGIQAIF